MPPSLAALLTFAFLSYLLFGEASARRRSDLVHWLPVLWIVIIGSRSVSQWLAIGSPTSPADESTLLDVLCFSSLIAAAAWVLHQRPSRLAGILSNNRWVVIFFMYCLLAVVWSDYPFVAFKRWVKVLGHPLMALVILTDRDPEAALRTIFKRCGFILLSCSILLVKYFPEYGRGFDAFTGAPVNRGVGLTKNDLGYICMIFGLYFVWALLTYRRIANPSERKREVLLSATFLVATFYLFSRADSVTSMIAFTAGAGVMLLLATRIVGMRRLGVWFISVATIGMALDAALGLREKLFRSLGRNPNLTDRTVVWTDVLALQDRPLLGFGFESFWLGPTRDTLWAKWWWQPIQAHNGYIETYLNLGVIGVVLLVAMLLSGFRKIQSSARAQPDLAMLRMAYLVAIVIFNYTEAGFKGLHLAWTIFCIVAMEVHTAQRGSASRKREPSVRVGAPNAPSRTLW